MARLRLSLSPSPALAALIVAAIACDTGGASRGPQHQETITWTGSVPSGGWLKVRDLNGSVRVSPSPDGLVHVAALKHWHRGSASAAHVETPQVGDTRYICALWGTQMTCGDNGGGDDHSLGRLFGRGSDMAVDLGIQIPRGVKLGVQTVNGSLTIGGATNDITLETVNGSIALGAHAGQVHAETVNGRIEARIDSVAPDAAVHLETVNGSVTLELPPQVNANIDLSTTIGAVRNGLPLASASPSDDAKTLRAVLGKGGGSVHLETVHGDVSLQPLPASTPTASVSAQPE